jgi:hypothetical protein
MNLKVKALLLVLALLLQVSFLLWTHHVYLENFVRQLR